MNANLSKNTFRIQKSELNAIIGTLRKECYFFVKNIDLEAIQDRSCREFYSNEAPLAVTKPLTVGCTGIRSEVRDLFH